MDTRYRFDRRRRARGAVRPVAVAIVAIFALLAVGVWQLIIKPHQELMMEDAGVRPKVPAATIKQAAPAPLANVGAMDVNQLLAEARKAINEQRYLAPVGNNAFEFYLKILEKQPGNQVASDALRETFPYAASAAEQAINANDFNDAQRQIDLLAKADPANFTLTILRSKLDAQRKVLDKQQKDALDQQQKVLAEQQKAAADKDASEKLAQQQKIAAAQAVTEAEQKLKQAHHVQEQVEQPATAPPAKTEETAAAETGGQTSKAVLVSGVAPTYPAAALRMRQTGWVVVSFTVEPNGRTSSVDVVNSQPRHVFDRAAMEAVSRYRFTPAMKDGAAVSSQTQQRIEFNL